MKDLGKTKFFLSLQIERFSFEVLIHQSTYTKKFFKCFYIDKAHPLSLLMVVCLVDVKKGQFCPCENGKQLLSLEVPYLSAIGALMYLANCTPLGISFFVNLLSMYSFSQTQRH